MKHVRQQIREAFSEKLDGITGVKGIHFARAMLLDPQEMPALIITTPEEKIHTLNGDPSLPEEKKRDVYVDVSLVVLMDEGADSFLDGVALEIERRIATAEGHPWDVLVRHDPLESELAVGDDGAASMFILTTRFICVFSAINATTIGD